MKIFRPSPALIVAIIALVVACAGTATAAKVLIRNSSQVAANAINGRDIRNGSITGVDIRSGSIGDRQLKRESITADKLADSVKRSFRSETVSAVEAVRRNGPGKNPANSTKVIATLRQLAPGTYAIFGKTMLSPDVLQPDILREALGNRQGAGHCVLNAGGEVDHARAVISAPGEQNPVSMSMQLTRTIDNPADVTITCDASQDWKATDTSIIAVALQGSQRVDVND